MADTSVEGGGGLSEGELEDGEVLSSEGEDEGEMEKDEESEPQDNGEKPEESFPPVIGTKRPADDSSSTDYPDTKAAKLEPPPSDQAPDGGGNGDAGSDVEEGEIFSDDEEAAYFPQRIKSRDTTGTAGAAPSDASGSEAAVEDKKTRSSRWREASESPEREPQQSSRRRRSRERVRDSEPKSLATLFFEDRDGTLSEQSDDGREGRGRRRGEGFRHSSSPGSSSRSGRDRDRERSSSNRDQRDREGGEGRSRYRTKDSHSRRGGTGSGREKDWDQDSNVDSSEEETSWSQRGGSRSKGFSHNHGRGRRGGGGYQSKFGQKHDRFGGSGGGDSRGSGGRSGGRDTSNWSHGGTGRMTTQELRAQAENVRKRREKGLSLLVTPKMKPSDNLDEFNYPAPPSWYLEAVEKWEKEMEEKLTAAVVGGGQEGAGEPVAIQQPQPLVPPANIPQSQPLVTPANMLQPQPLFPPPTQFTQTQQPPLGDASLLGEPPRPLMPGAQVPPPTGFQLPMPPQIPSLFPPPLPTLVPPPPLQQTLLQPYLVPPPPVPLMQPPPPTNGPALRPVGGSLNMAPFVPQAVGRGNNQMFVVNSGVEQGIAGGVGDKEERGGKAVVSTVRVSSLALNLANQPGESGGKGMEEDEEEEEEEGRMKIALETPTPQPSATDTKTFSFLRTESTGDSETSRGVDFDQVAENENGAKSENNTESTENISASDEKEVEKEEEKMEVDDPASLESLLPARTTDSQPEVTSGTNGDPTKPVASTSDPSPLPTTNTNTNTVPYSPTSAPTVTTTSVENPVTTANPTPTPGSVAEAEMKTYSPPPLSLLQPPSSSSSSPPSPPPTTSLPTASSSTVSTATTATITTGSEFGSPPTVPAVATANEHSVVPPTDTTTSELDAPNVITGSGFDAPPAISTVATANEHSVVPPTDTTAGELDTPNVITGSGFDAPPAISTVSTANEHSVVPPTYTTTNQLDAQNVATGSGFDAPPAISTVATANEHGVIPPSIPTDTTTSGLDAPNVVTGSGLDAPNVASGSGLDAPAIPKVATSAPVATGSGFDIGFEGGSREGGNKGKHKIQRGEGNSDMEEGDIDEVDSDYDKYLDQLDEEEDGEQVPSSALVGAISASLLQNNPLDEDFPAINPTAAAPPSNRGGETLKSLLVGKDRVESDWGSRGRGSKSERRKQKESEWWSKQKNNKKPPRANSPAIKPPCKFYLNGFCKQGEECHFSHEGSPRPKKKKERCKFYIQGSCTKGEDCRYYHGEFPCKFYHTASASGCKNGDNCKFSHAPLTEETSQLLAQVLDARTHTKWADSAPLLGFPPTANPANLHHNPITLVHGPNSHINVQYFTAPMSGATSDPTLRRPTDSYLASPLLISIPKQVFETSLVVSIPRQKLGPPFGTVPIPTPHPAPANQPTHSHSTPQPTLPLPLSAPQSSGFHPPLIPPTGIPSLVPPHSGPPGSFPFPQIPNQPQGNLPPHPPGGWQAPPPQPVPLFPPPSGGPPPVPLGQPPHMPPQFPPPPLSERKCLLPTPPSHMRLDPKNILWSEDDRPEYWEAPAPFGPQPPPGGSFAPPPPHVPQQPQVPVGGPPQLQPSSVSSSGTQRNQSVVPPDRMDPRQNRIEVARPGGSMDPRRIIPIANAIQPMGVGDPRHHMSGTTAAVPPPYQGPGGPTPGQPPVPHPGYQGPPHPPTCQTWTCPPHHPPPSLSQLPPNLHPQLPVLHPPGPTPVGSIGQPPPHHTGQPGGPGAFGNPTPFQQPNPSFSGLPPLPSWGSGSPDSSAVPPPSTGREGEQPRPQRVDPRTKYSHLKIKSKSSASSSTLATSSGGIGILKGSEGGEGGERPPSDRTHMPKLLQEPPPLQRPYDPLELFDSAASREVESDFPVSGPFGTTFGSFFTRSSPPQGGGGKNSDLPYGEITMQSITEKESRVKDTVPEKQDKSSVEAVPSQTDQSAQGNEDKKSNSTKSAAVPLYLAELGVDSDLTIDSAFSSLKDGGSTAQRPGGEGEGGPKTEVMAKKLPSIFGFGSGTL